MVSNWITIEDEQEMIEFEAQEELDKLDKLVIQGAGDSEDSDDDCDKEGEAKVSVMTMEQDETPCVFENHMQVEENLMEMQRFASQNSYPATFYKKHGFSYR
jgi:hypothetical protein